MGTAVAKQPAMRIVAAVGTDWRAAVKGTY